MVFAGAVTRIGTSDLDVFPLGLGCNVFGFTVDHDSTASILDPWVEGGGNLLDTADSYSSWVPGNVGGESERAIGEWLRRSRRRDEVVIATKVSKHPDFFGLSAQNIRAAAEASLGRMGIETIDLYYAHFDDLSVEIEEMVEAFGSLVRDGLVRYVGVSNFAPERIEEWIRVAGDGPAAPIAIQPHYNLVHRNDVEDHVIPIAERHGLSLIPYFGLAHGFLTGKYRSKDIPEGASPRAQGAVKYVSPQGLAILDTLDEIASAHGVSAAAVALAWLRAQPSVAAPLASATTPQQLAGLLDAGRLELAGDEVEALTRVSTWTPPGA